MLETIIFLAIIALIVISILAYPFFIKWRRNRLKNFRISPLWQAIITEKITIYDCLSPDERKRLRGHLQAFLREKQFIGCRGLEITEEIKMTIAAVACLLLLNERGSYFSQLKSILVYPSTYLVREKSYQGNYVVEENSVARLGESWTNDQVVLSWEQIQQDTHNWQDGHNVILHEFAHQLDQEDGKAEGVPILPKYIDYSLWAKVMTQEYQQLCHDVERGIKTVIDSYGATNPAEFFAVATETFFEKPHQLQTKHPALYGLLQQYYQLNPLQWV